MMDVDASHRMVFVETGRDGSDRFDCLVCGRRLLFNYEPLRMTVLIEGDTAAGHSGSKGDGLRITAVKAKKQ
jgi:hypothetical protein